MQSQQQNQPKKSEENTQPEIRINLDDIPKPELSGHAWRTQGTMLICESCPFTHTSYIPPEFELVGVQSDGIPKFRKRTFNNGEIPEEAIGLTVAEYRKLRQA